MGCVCCCFKVRDPEDDLNSSNDRSCCICFNSLIHTILNKYESLFRDNQISRFPSTNDDQTGQEAVLSTSNVPPDNVTSPPRSFGLDPNLELQIRDNGIVTKPEKGGAALRMDKDSQQFSNSGYISLEHVKGDLIQKCRLDSSTKSSEDEDVCPTCLEEYTFDNPRTVMQCSHHYHLSCIYEWMERSATCPMCGKVMLLDETT